MSIIDDSILAPVLAALEKVATEEQWVNQKFGVEDLPQIIETELVPELSCTVYQLSFSTKSPFVPVIYMYFYNQNGTWKVFTTEEGDRKFHRKSNDRILRNCSQLTVGTTAEFIKVLRFELNY